MKKYSNRPQTKRFNRAVNVATPLRKVTKPLLRANGFTEPDIIHRWSEIVGEQLGAMSCPMRISRDRSSGNNGATLLVRVAGAAALELDHLAPQILERINVYYGYKAIARLRLEQGPLPMRTRPARPFQRKLSAREKESLHQSVEGVHNPELRQSLETLGQAVLSSKKR